MRTQVSYIGPDDTPSKEATAKKIRWLKGFGPAITARILNGETVSIVTDEAGLSALSDSMYIAYFVNEPEAKQMVGAPAIPKPTPRGGIDLMPVVYGDGILPPAPVAPAPVAPAPAAPAAASPDLGALLGGMVLSSIQPLIAAEVAKGLAAIEKKEPRPIKIIRPDADAVVLNERTHPMFDKVVRLVSNRINVMLVGPAGCGKTHLFSQVAKALGREHASISLSAGVTEANLLGRLLPSGEGGRFQYTETPFVKMYREGGAFLLDEMDGADPNVMLGINQATANGGFHIESRSVSGLDTFVPRHENNILMATANTYGTGAGAMYVGRNQMDAATLDRWYVVNMDYDKDFEEQIGSPEVSNFVWKLREVIAENKWRRVASTRMIQKGTAALKAGIQWATVKKDLLAGYTESELQKVRF